jgi:tripartite-type tricarboxylate transporter receptor subunit TctC
LAEFLAHAKSVEGKLSYGFGSPAARVATEALASIEQFKAVGVPYRGQPQAITDLMGGQFDFLMADLPVLAPHVKTGKLRALAVFSDKRSPLLPEIPTMGEAGIKGYSLAAWVGLSGPAKMPPEVVTRLSTAAAKILSRPDVADYLLQFGLEYTPNTPREFDQFVRVQLGAWTKYVRAAGIDPE